MSLLLLSPLTLGLLPVGLLLDRLLGEPGRRWHPLVGFGVLATRLAARLNRGGTVRRRVGGGVAWGLLVGLPAGLVGWGVSLLPVWGGAVVGVGLLWLALGGRSLTQHAQVVATALMAGDLAHARARTGWLVSRETDDLDPAGCAGATVESVLENGADAVFAPLFWFAVAGVPGVVGYRLANTLDAMWGYRTPELRAFGWTAARADDLLNTLPARLTAVSYVALGQAGSAWRAWRRDAPGWASPNAGPVMAAGAGALALRLGGTARYHGAVCHRPSLGDGAPATAADIARACALVNRVALLWGGLALALALAWVGLTGGGV